jgi:hypothetical protein
MIICTGCGKNNDDAARQCESCGRKLQSSRRACPVDDPSGRRLERFSHAGIDPRTRASLLRMAEAWCYVAALGLAAAGCALFDTWWPMYPAIGLVALTAWLRRV